MSASAIFLLRALDRDHTKESKVGDQIFPCCGHSIYDVGEEEVVICGCPSGIDFEIRHRSGLYTISTKDGREIAVPEAEWESAVVRYSNQILSFYEQSSLKEPSDEEDRKGFDAMMVEWYRLQIKHKDAEQAGGGNPLPLAPHP